MKKNPQDDFGFFPAGLLVCALLLLAAPYGHVADVKGLEGELPKPAQSKSSTQQGRSSAPDSAAKSPVNAGCRDDAAWLGSRLGAGGKAEDGPAVYKRLIAFQAKCQKSVPACPQGKEIFPTGNPASPVECWDRPAVLKLLRLLDPAAGKKATSALRSPAAAATPPASAARAAGTAPAAAAAPALAGPSGSVRIDLLDYLLPDDGRGNHMSNQEFFYAYAAKGNRLFIRKSCDPRWYESFTYDNNFIYLNKDTTWTDRCNDTHSPVSGIYGGTAYGFPRWKRYWTGLGDSYRGCGTVIGESKTESPCRQCGTQWSGSFCSTVKLTHQGTVTLKTGVVVANAIILTVTEGAGQGEGFIFSKSRGWIGFVTGGAAWDGRTSSGAPVLEACPIPLDVDPTLMLGGC